MLIKKYNETSCINGCKLFNDSNNFQYWEDKNETTDESEIVSYINENYKDKFKSILHVGIGNSFLAQNQNIVGLLINLLEEPLKSFSLQVCVVFF